MLYARYKRRDATVELPSAPLLYVPSHPARSLDKDLEAAGIPKHAPGGKIDFHACRVAYINLVLESGAKVKEAQTLARHATPELTMNVYGRARKERLSEVVEQMAKSVVREEKYVPSMQRQAVGAETESATPNENKEFRLSSIGGGGVHRKMRLTLCATASIGHQGQRHTPEYTPFRLLVRPFGSVWPGGRGPRARRVRCAARCGPARHVV